MNVLVYFYYGIMCDVFISMSRALYEMSFVLYKCCIMLVFLLGVLVTLMLFSLSINC